MLERFFSLSRTKYYRIYSINRLQPKKLLTGHPQISAQPNPPHPPPNKKNISVLAQCKVRGASVVFQNWF